MTDVLEHRIYAYDMNTKARDADKDFDTLSDAGLVSPLGIWSDGATMWVSLWRNNKLFAFNFSTKARDASKDFDTLLTAGSNLPTVIWSDGITLWVADHDDDKLYSYNLSRDEALDLKFLGVNVEPPKTKKISNIST